MKAKTMILILILSMNIIYAKEIIIASGISIPPYVIKETNSGMQLDVVREALQLKGYTVKNIIYASNKRIERLLFDKVVDIVINIPVGIKNIYYSDVIVESQNVAISLTQNNFNIEKINNLIDKRVLGFQNASKFLGKEFSNFTQNNKNYSEVIQQVAQVNHLYKKNFDVIISDKMIFIYYRDLHKEIYDPKIKLDFFDIFSQYPRKAGFLNSTLRDDFNEGLQQLKKSKIFQSILEKYNFPH